MAELLLYADLLPVFSAVSVHKVERAAMAGKGRKCQVHHFREFLVPPPLPLPRIFENAPNLPQSPVFLRILLPRHPAHALFEGQFASTAVRKTTRSSKDWANIPFHERSTIFHRRCADYSYLSPTTCVRQSANFAARSRKALSRIPSAAHLSLYSMDHSSFGLLNPMTGRNHEAPFRLPRPSELSTASCR